MQEPSPFALSDEPESALRRRPHRRWREAKCRSYWRCGCFFPRVGRASGLGWSGRVFRPNVERHERNRKWLWRFFLFDACLLSRLGFVGTQMGGADDHDSNASADAVVHALGEHIILPGGIKVKRAGIRPMPHNREPVK